VAVRSALLAAAADLFADRGPSHVSVREIALAAGVNHGLVHHYFGSKEALLRAVLDDLAGESAIEVAAWDGHSGLLEAEGPVGRHGRIVAHLLLDARNPADVQTTFPAIDALTAHLRSHGVSAREASERAAAAAALVLGWQLFAPFLERAAGLDDEAVDAEVLGAGVRRLLAPDP
jgi:TetR/AcrR family transcriptional regulator, repressor for neighboring sulfatase